MRVDGKVKTHFYFPTLTILDYDRSMLAPGYFEQQAPIAAAENGISVELAKKYLSLIGDTPEFDPSDPEHVVVSDEQGHEIARIKWPVGAASTPVR